MLSAFFNCSIKIYRGSPRTLVRDNEYGSGFNANIQSIEREHKPEYIQDLEIRNADNATHSIFFNIISGYKPFVEDIVVVSGTDEGIDDGEYVVEEYSKPESGYNSPLTYIELRIRSLTAKKLGDNPSSPNNSKVMKFG